MEQSDPGESYIDHRCGERVMFLDINGFLTSREFLVQFAAFIAALFSGVLQTLLGGFAGTS